MSQDDSAEPGDNGSASRPSMPAPRHTRPPSIPDLYVGFFMAGMATTLLGPVLPALTQRWEVSDALIGLAFTVQFLGSVSMSVLSSSLVMRFGGGRIMLAGFALMAAGVGALAVAAWLPGLAAILCYGLGLGLVLPTTNVLVAAASPGREASAISLVNVSWSGGAVAWPLVVAYLGAGEAVAFPLLVLAALMAGMTMRLLLTDGRSRGAAPVPSLPVVGPPVADAPRGQTVKKVRIQDLTPPAVLAAFFSALLFFYAGGEAATGGWVAEHVRRMEGPGPGARWTIAPM